MRGEWWISPLAARMARPVATAEISRALGAFMGEQAAPRLHGLPVFLRVEAAAFSPAIVPRPALGDHVARKVDAVGQQNNIGNGAAITVAGVNGDAHVLAGWRQCAQRITGLRTVLLT